MIRSAFAESSTRALKRSLVATTTPRPQAVLSRAFTSSSSSATATAEAQSLASSIYTSPPLHPTAATSTTPSLPAHHRATLASLLRVDHSGEIAANTIYAAQAYIFSSPLRNDATAKDLTLEMWESEKKHLKVAEMLLRQHRVRPSALNPVWGALGSLLGGVTAAMGREAAMACTEAVETVIGEHYDDQIRHIDEVLASFKPEVKEDLPESAAAASSATASAPVNDAATAEALKSIETLRGLLEEFRDDELEHLDTAVEHDAQQAPAHALLSAVIQAGCKGAIEVAKRI
ncbi:COQ7-domain-containing protein [Jaminaea rosea]|uniref:5-demethoxyubiquinone hydroxylase, mitochondrial n=1 Tax=Jaminaea rosea TaxID=1569628 RepID=A0A316V1C8_9BASI|nr:COQ7-domain-containing protein [Jaminaea rosea]PWN31054.1 COQ7-domain-containing protein [Jaminaea rosea]